MTMAPAETGAIVAFGQGQLCQFTSFDTDRLASGEPSGQRPPLRCGRPKTHRDRRPLGHDHHR